MASAKNYTEVLIGGKVFTLSGFESEEYLQKVSAYLNHKLTECSNNESYRKQSADTRSILQMTTLKQRHRQIPWKMTQREGIKKYMI